MVTAEHPHTVTPSTVILSHCHALTLSYPHFVTPSHCHTLYYIAVMPSHCHILTLSHPHTHTLILSHTHTLTLSHHHTLTDPGDSCRCWYGAGRVYQSDQQLLPRGDSEVHMKRRRGGGAARRRDITCRYCLLTFLYMLFPGL